MPIVPLTAWQRRKLRSPLRRAERTSSSRRLLYPRRRRTDYNIGDIGVRKP